MDLEVARKTKAVNTRATYIVDNLVYCCDSCNIIKTNKGLREFCRIREIDFLEVVDRLEKLGKHV